MTDCGASTASTPVAAVFAVTVTTGAVEMVGVEPSGEQRAFKFVRTVAAGRYLREGDRAAMIVGKAVAERLDAGVGDEILATAVGAGTQAIALALKSEAGLLVNPGYQFGPRGEGHFRICFAQDAALLAEGLSRIAEALRRQETK